MEKVAAFLPLILLPLGIYFFFPIMFFIAEYFLYIVAFGLAIGILNAFFLFKDNLDAIKPPPADPNEADYTVYETKPGAPGYTHYWVRKD